MAVPRSDDAPDGAETAPPSAPKDADRRNRNRLGILLMLLACLGFTANSAATKLLTQTVPPTAILFYQYAIITLVMLALLSRMGIRRVLKVSSPRMHLVRAGTFVANMFLFIYGLGSLPYSTAAMLAFVNPLFMTALAPFLLKEKVGWHRWSAVLVGLSGVAVIVQPWSGALAIVLLLPLGSAFCGALRDIITRKMTHSETSESMLLYSSAAVVLASGMLTARSLPALTTSELGLLTIVALGQLVGLYSAMESLRQAEAAVVAPFKYSNLLWIIAADVVIWGAFPPLNVMLGAAIIVASMLYIYLREHRRGQRPAVTTLIEPR